MKVSELRKALEHFPDEMEVSNISFENPDKYAIAIAPAIFPDSDLKTEILKGEAGGSLGAEPSASRAIDEVVEDVLGEDQDLGDGVSPLPWRVGRKVGRTLYDARNNLIGMMDTPWIASTVVIAVNKLRPEDVDPR